MLCKSLHKKNGKNVDQLTNQQKTELVNWIRKIQKTFIIFMVWLFLISPLLILFLKKLETKKLSNSVIWVNAIILVILFAYALKLRNKKCPNCGVTIAGGHRIISLPDKCHHCGVPYK